MKTWQILCVLISSQLAATRLSATEPPVLDSHLEPLRPMLEKTWRGEFKSSTPQNPVVDVMRWERALNGKAVRVLHSVNDGAYGGETLFRWDEQKQSVTYHYFTTAGFMTTGTVKFEGGKSITHEIVTGSANGVSEVRGTSELAKDGTFTVKTEYFKDGTWQPARETTYRENTSAKVVFK